MTDLESKTVCVDIDQTICLASGSNYVDAAPYPGAKDALAELRKSGWVVVLYTARHFNHWQVTVEWLRRFGFEYDQIVFGKPPARFYIDDRAVRFQGDWQQVCQDLGIRLKALESAQ